MDPARPAGAGGNDVEILIGIVLALIVARAVFATVRTGLIVFVLVLIGLSVLGHFDLPAADSIRPAALQLLVMLAGLRIMARGLLG